VGDSALPPARATLLAVGAFGKPHGIRGELTFRPFGSWPAGVAVRRGEGLSVWLERADGFEAARVEAHRPAGEHWIVRLSGISTREEAAGLTGALVHVSRTDLPALDEGEFYVADLPGLEARNEQGEVLGRVTATFWNGAHDVATVVGPRGELLIPLVPAVVQRVDVRAGIVEVLWNADDLEDGGEESPEGTRADER